VAGEIIEDVRERFRRSRAGTRRWERRLHHLSLAAV